MQEIHKKRAKLFAFLGCFYLLIQWVSVPCLFRQITTLECPGCGMTRAMLAILHFDFVGAFYYNPFCYILLLFILQYFIYGKISIKKWQSIILLIGLITFGVLRNVL